MGPLTGSLMSTVDNVGAQRAGVTTHTISDLEQQLVAARPSTIRKLADALNCTPRELMEAP